MAIASTVISAAVGENPLGKAAPNKPSDVTRVQGLLRKALGGACPPFRDGVFDKAMKEVIMQFQREWGGVPDGMVDPHGQTMKRLDRLANPLTLNAISLDRVVETYRNNRMVLDGGGYSISYKTSDGGPMPPGNSNYAVYLAVGSEDDIIDVTERPSRDLMSMANLPDLLRIFEEQQLWNATVDCELQVWYGQFVISTSNSQELTSPVQPHTGRLVPLDELANGAKLTYQGNPSAHDYHGRMFIEVPGYSKCLFIYGGKFETDPQYRGFDCITYVGTACGGSNMHMKESPDMAMNLGATPVVADIKTKHPKTGKESVESKTLDYANPNDVRQFFETTSPTGSFIMWRGDHPPGSHVVLVVDGMVHEFNKTSQIDGYGSTPILKWIDDRKDKKLTVRKLPTKPLRALQVAPLLVSPPPPSRAV